MKIFGFQMPAAATGQVALTMGSALLFGIVMVFFGLWSNGTFWRGLMWAGAWSAVGWFLGFIFGIPRYLSTDTARRPVSAALESAKRELADAIGNADNLRAAAEASARTLADADKQTNELSKAADQADAESAAAAARATADPQDADLQAEAATKAKAAVSARLASDQAAAALPGAAARAATDANDAQVADSKVEAAKAKVDKADTADKAAPSGTSLTVNTNLEQISDWLTKIIVGVSLVESNLLLAKMGQAAIFMAKSMANTEEVAAFALAAPAAAAASAAAAGGTSAVAVSAAATARSLASFESTESFAYGLMLYFLATGLLGSYLLTRLYLQKALDDAANQ